MLGFLYRDDLCRGEGSACPQMNVRLPAKPHVVCDYRTADAIAVRGDRNVVSAVIATGTLPKGFDPSRFGVPMFLWGCDPQHAPEVLTHPLVKASGDRTGRLAAWDPCPTCKIPGLVPGPPTKIDSLVACRGGGKLFQQAVKERWSPMVDPVGDPLSDLIRMISQSASVVTDDWHCAYWAALCGRKVATVGFGPDGSAASAGPFGHASFPEEGPDRFDPKTNPESFPDRWPDPRRGFAAECVHIVDKNGTRLWDLFPNKAKTS